MMELSWEEVGIEPELTTVTKLPRRVFNFSVMQLEEALYQCGPTKLFLNFANYMDFESLKILVGWIQMTGANVEWIGLGPRHDDIVMSMAKAQKIMEAQKND